MIMTQHEEQLSLPITPPNVLSGSREAMEPLYEQLLQQAFPDSHSAVQFCRHACAEFGFTVKQEASANRNIYVYCSREGLPDSQRKPKSAPQRKRPSKRCDCRWRVVLTENSQGLWEFRKASSPTAYEHNHEMMDPKEMVKSWPSEVNTFIIQLARQRMQTHEIRDFVKQRFPNITWNERRFYNRLTEERKRIKQRDVMERSQRLLFLSAKMCSLVAANDEWSMNVEHELTRLCDTYAQLNRLNPDVVPLTDFNVDQITVDLDQFLQSSTNVQQPPPAYLFEEHRSSFSSDEESSSSMIKMEIDDHTIQSTNGIPQLTTTTNNNNNNNNNNNLATATTNATTTTTIAAVSTSSQPKNSNKKRKSILLDDISTCSSPPSSQQQTSSPPSTTWSSTITPPKGTHVVYVPAYALFVRSHNTRSSSDTSSTSSSSHLTHRKSFQHDITSPSSLMDISSPHPQQTMSFHPPHPHHHHHHHHHDNPSFYSLASPTSPSSSSVTSHFQHRPPSSSSTTSTMNHPTSPPSMIHTSTTNVTTPSHFQPSPPSDHPPHSFYMKSTYPQQQQQQPSSSSLNQPHSFNGMPLQQAAQIYSMQSFSNYSPSSTNTNLSNNNNNASNNNSNNNNNNNNNATDMNFAFDQASLSTTDPTSPPQPHSATSNQRHPTDMYRTMMEFNPNHHQHPSSQQQDPRYMYSNNNGTNSGDGSTTTTSEPMNTSSHYRPSSNSSTHSASQRLQTDHPDMMNRLMMDQASMS